MSPSQQKLPPIIGIGAGGHAKVIIEILLQSGQWEIAGLLDADETKTGQTFSGVPILGTDVLIPELFQKGIHAAFVGIGSVGAVSPRRKAFDILLDHGFELPALRHPSATVASDVTLGKATCIMPGAIINPGASIGECVIVNLGAIIEHDCHISDFAHISPGALLGGDVFVGQGAHIGIGAVIRQGIRIGENAMVGAGAVVVKDVEAGTTVIGVPAAPKP